jgi:hypothetical protein
MVVTLELVQSACRRDASAAAASAGGRSHNVDRSHGPTTLFLFEVPSEGETLQRVRG